jgi:hypothetical protein
MLKIETSLDWNNIETEIKQLGRTMPMFKHDIKRLCDTIRPEITKLGNLEVEHRRMHSRTTDRDCKQQVEKINETLKLFQKFHLMALLGS